MKSFILKMFFALLIFFGFIHSSYSQEQKQKKPMGGPFFHQVMSSTSQDGLNWTDDEKVILEHASVPAAMITPEGWIRLYYVDASHAPENINCAESRDGGKTFKVLGCQINFKGYKGVDPSIVTLPNESYRYRLYYYRFPEFYPPDPHGDHSIYSALSIDGISFTEEKEVFRYPGLVDPDVFWNGKEWVMYVFSLTDGKTIVAKSQDGLQFKYEGPLSIQQWGTTRPLKLSDGRFRLYAFNQGAQDSFVSFISSDTATWTEEEGVRLKAKPGYEITDPYVVQLDDGTWKMFYKVSPAISKRPN